MSAVHDIFATHFGWPYAVALGFFALTLTALALLNPERKTEIGKWLAGRWAEDSWASTFITLFDSLFGDNHLSLKCFLRSAIASVITVSLIWWLMGKTGMVARVELGGMTLTRALALGIAINIVADYISLYETRWLLGRLADRPGWQQALILAVDLAISAAIILAVIFLARLTGAVPDDGADWLAVGLAFSVYSAPFYSTFLTSVWTWTYILSTWLLRGVKKLRLAHWLDVEGKPTLILSLILSVFVYLGAAGLDATTQKDPEIGLSPLDRLACETFPGEICLRMIGIADSEEMKVFLQQNACEAGKTRTCADAAESRKDIDPVRAVELWRSACIGGSVESCGNLGFMYEHGIGVAKDVLNAERLYAQSCDSGHNIGCVNLGNMYATGKGVKKNNNQAKELFSIACSRGDSTGCTSQGLLLIEGPLDDQNVPLAAKLFDFACKLEDVLACHELAMILLDGQNPAMALLQGFILEKDPARAARLLDRACNLEHPHSCTVLGTQHLVGYGVERDLHLATAHFKKACEMDDADGCLFLGVSFRDGFGVVQNKAQALIYLRKSCELGAEDVCAEADALAASAE